MSQVLHLSALTASFRFRRSLPLRFSHSRDYVRGTYDARWCVGGSVLHVVAVDLEGEAGLYTCTGFLREDACHSLLLFSLLKSFS